MINFPSHQLLGKTVYVEKGFDFEFFFFTLSVETAAFVDNFRRGT